MIENISFQVNLSDDFDSAVEKVTDALKNEGFGIMTEIDVKETLKKKVDVDFRKYTILGACNPPLAHKALQNEPLIGLVLPCNVTVEEVETGSLVNIANPRAVILSIPILEKNEVVKEVSEDAYARLSRVAQALETDQ